MKTVIEVAVFCSQEELFDIIFEPSDTFSEKQYHDFKLFEYNLNNDVNLFFYLLTAVPDLNDALLMDQVVTKAPFTLFIIDPKGPVENNPTLQLFENYNLIFATPALLLVLKDSEEHYKKYTDEKVLPENENDILLFDAQAEKPLNQIILSAIKKTSPVNL